MRRRPGRDKVQVQGTDPLVGQRNGGSLARTPGPSILLRRSQQQRPLHPPPQGALGLLRMLGELSCQLWTGPHLWIPGTLCLLESRMAKGSQNCGRSWR